MAKQLARSGSVRAPFAHDPPHAEKNRRGRTAVEQTPLSIVTPRFALPGDFEAYVRAKLGSKLGKFATQIESVGVTFVDLNGPKRGVDTECRVKVSLHPLPTLLVTERGINARQAFDRVCNSVVQAVQRSLARAGFSEGRARRREQGKAGRLVELPNSEPPTGSRSNRRVARSKEEFRAVSARPEKNRRDKNIDASKTDLSATDRKAGSGSTAGRNLRKRTTKAAVALEDSATGKPSRKSTRKGANRLKSGETKERVARDQVITPQFRATSAGVHRK